MYAIGEMLQDFITSDAFNDNTNTFVVTLKHFLRSKIYKLDNINYKYFDCTVHFKKNEEENSVISVIPFNLYSLVFLSLGEKPDMKLLRGLHNETNQEPFKYDTWTLYFNKEEPIAINKTLKKSVNTVNKFNL